MSKNVEGLVGSLNDSCFVHAGECMATLCQMIEEETGTKPSLKDLCEVLAVSLQGCNGDLLSDVDVQAVEELIPKVVPHKYVTLRPGDVLAVPRKKGGYYFIVCITHNKFGYAFGLFQGHRQVPFMPAKWEPVPVKYPVHSGRAFVVTGRWRRIANRKDLLEAFPKSPEIYHSKADNESDDQIGPFGTGETATGELRDLSEVEALELGLLQGTYRQIMVEEQLEDYLNDTLA